MYVSDINDVMRGFVGVDGCIEVVRFLNLSFDLQE